MVILSCLIIGLITGALGLTALVLLPISFAAAIMIYHFDAPVLVLIGISFIQFGYLAGTMIKSSK